tara:strand:+ start:4712 stop:5395 length:684 start_codon:yes stop_codon:yes gene_type:complete
MTIQKTFDKFHSEMITCTKCTRLVAFREKIATEKRKQYLNEEYWGKPIPGYGDINAEILFVGLAPAAHGGNRTGRVFTGDKSADFLMKCMHHTGLANQINSDYRDDGLVLNNAYMTAMLKCVPPQDKPTATELKNCFGYFNREMKLLENLKTIVALGKIAFDGTLKYYKQFDDLKTKDFQFGHGKSYKMPNGINLIGCYHPSPRNVNTGKLNFEMMVNLFQNLKNYY